MNTNPKDAYRIDLHVHTSRYSPCAELMAPEGLGTAAKQTGLAGLVVCEHDVLWPAHEMRDLQERLGGQVKLYRGVEVSAAEGHFTVIGLDTLEGILPGIPVNRLVEVSHRRGAAVVLAHPYRPVHGLVAADRANALPDLLDAIEIYSSGTVGRQSEAARALGAQRGWSAVAGSDAHSAEMIGWVSTAFPYLPEDDRELADAIRAALGTPLPHVLSGEEQVDNASHLHTL